MAVASSPASIGSAVIGWPIASPPGHLPISNATSRVEAVPRLAPATQTAIITVTAPRELQVGEQKELVVNLGADSEVAEVAFTVRFDGSVLQVRNGAEGDWAMVTGAKSRFEADISGTEDRIQVRSAVTSTHPIATSRSVALVQFQAIAPGTVSVMISDVTVKDRVGRPLPFSISPSTLQVTAESGVPPT